MIRLRPSRPETAPTPSLSPPAETVIRRFFRLIRRFEKRKGAIEVKAAPETKARITRFPE